MELKIGIARASAMPADICGDMARSWTCADRVVIAIADGLGHGRDAAVASGRAMAYIGDHLGDDLPTLFKGMAEALASTRGAAVGVAIVRPAVAELTYAAVGNTRAAVFGWRSSRLDADPGIVGGGLRRLSLVTLPFRPGDHLALWTDGLEERLSMGDAAATEVGTLAETLLQRYCRGDDDACVVVARMAA